MTLYLTESECSSESDFWGAFYKFVAEKGKPNRITVPVNCVRMFQVISGIDNSIFINGFGQFLGIYVDIGDVIGFADWQIKGSCQKGVRFLSSPHSV